MPPSCERLRNWSDLGQGFAFVFGISLDDADQLGNQIMPTLQLHIDIAPSRTHPVAIRNELVECDQAEGNRGDKRASQHPYAHCSPPPSNANPMME